MLGLSAPDSLGLGQLGSDYITGAVALPGNGPWGRIHALAATVIATLTVGNLPNGSVTMSGTLTSVPLSAGDEIQGYFTACTLTSGTILAYRM